MANKHKSRYSDAVLPRADNAISLGWPASNGGGNEATRRITFMCASHKPASMAEIKHTGTTTRESCSAALSIHMLGQGDTLLNI